MEENEDSKQSKENDVFSKPQSKENAKESSEKQSEETPEKSRRKRPSNQPQSVKEDLKSAYELRKSLQQLIQDINLKRKRDNEMVTAFREAMSTAVTKICTAVEEKVAQMHEKSNKIIQEKLQKVMASIDKIEKLEGEYDEFKQSLSLLYNDTCMIPN